MRCDNVMYVPYFFLMAPDFTEKREGMMKRERKNPRDLIFILFEKAATGGVGMMHASYTTHNSFFLEKRRNIQYLFFFFYLKRHRVSRIKVGGIEGERTPYRYSMKRSNSHASR